MLWPVYFREGRPQDARMYIQPPMQDFLPYHLESKSTFKSLNMFQQHLAFAVTIRVFSGHLFAHHSSLKSCIYPRRQTQHSHHFSLVTVGEKGSVYLSKSCPSGFISGTPWFSTTIMFLASLRGATERGRKSQGRVGRILFMVMTTTTTTTKRYKK